MLSIDINLLFTVINVLVLFVLVKLFLFKPIHKILDERQQMIDNDLKAAEAARLEAAALVTQHQEALDNIEEARMQAMQETTQKASETYDQIVESANKQAETIIRDAEREAERQRQAVLRQTDRQLRTMIVKAAEKVSASQSCDNSRLYDQFLEKVGDGNDEDNA